MYWYAYAPAERAVPATAQRHGWSLRTRVVARELSLARRRLDCLGAARQREIECVYAYMHLVRSAYNMHTRPECTASPGRNRKGP